MLVPRKVFPALTQQYACHKLKSELACGFQRLEQGSRRQFVAVAAEACRHGDGIPTPFGR